MVFDRPIFLYLSTFLAEQYAAVLPFVALIEEQAIA